MFDDKIVSHLNRDRTLAPLLKREWVRPSKPSQGLFHDLVSAIISQQISTTAARTIRDRLTSRFTDELLTAQGIIALTEEEMRAVGLSRQKISYITNIAVHFHESGLSEEDYHHMNDEEIIDDLTEIKGVGRWTVEMILMHTFRRPDVFPEADLGIQNAMIELYKIEGKGKVLRSAMREIAESWRPYRSYGTWALWNSLH